MNQKYILFMAMLVLAIFAVGSVSASDDIATDIDVPTEDIAVDDVTVDETDEIDDVSSDDSNKVINTRYSETVTAGSNSSAINDAINRVYNNGGGNVNFESGNYTDISITLLSNVNLIGNGALLIGDGVNNVINIQDNTNNIVITGFSINANYTSSAHNISAIRGSFVTNAQITNNTIYNSYNGINLNKYCANINVSDNTIYDMINDGVSFANPITFSTISTVGYSYISRNNISNCGYGIFVGGNFNGEIANDKISNCTYGIEFAGKPKAGNGTLQATLSYVDIIGCTNGINMYHPYADYLSLEHVTFSQITGYDVHTTGTVNGAGYIEVTYSTFCQGVTSAFNAAVDWEFGNTNYHVKTP